METLADAVREGREAHLPHVWGEPISYGYDSPRPSAAPPTVPATRVPPPPPRRSR
jgi:hypothetical protein